MEAYEIFGLVATTIVVVPWEPLLAWVGYRVWKSVAENLDSSAEISLSDYSTE